MVVPPPKFPWSSYAISILLSLFLTLVLWSITEAIYRSTGYRLPWWAQLIIFLGVFFLVFWLVSWGIKARRVKKMEAARAPSAFLN
jgi:hypothetical protein